MRNVSQELDEIAGADDFDAASAALAREWQAQGVGVEAVEPVLRFIEAHPDLDYGAPGALAHFVERFYRKGYEPLLLQSLRRRPTELTVWLLHRVLNGAKAPEERGTLAAALEAAREHPQADGAARRLAAGFLEGLSGRS